MRKGPSDSAGLFAGRRPGTTPTQCRTLPQRAGDARQRPGGSLANLLLPGRAGR
jgi:hypothetical protein